MSPRHEFRMARSLFVATLLFLTFSQPANADTITAVSPFVGQFSETFESFPTYRPPGTFTSVPLPAATPILGGLGTITSIWDQVSGGYVYQFPFVCNPLCDNYGLAGAGIARVADGTKGLGSIGTTILKFNQGVLQFGGYWGVSVGFPFTGQATLTFLDHSGDPIGIATITYLESSAGTLVWNGFASSVPFYQINVESNNHSLAMDGLQAHAAPVPEVSSLVTIVVGALGLTVLWWRSQLQSLSAS